MPTNPKNVAKSDLILEYAGKVVGYNIAIDPQTQNKRLYLGLADKLAPQVRQDSVSYSYLPPAVDIVAAFEDWRGGAGLIEADPTDVAPLAYNYSQGIDLSVAHRAYIAPQRSEALLSTGTSINQAPVKYWDGSDGVFMIAGTGIYKWDTSSNTWVIKDDASADAVSYTDIMEMDGILYAARGANADYKYSTDGEAWTAFTGSDDNFTFFAVRGIASAEAVMWGLKATGILKNTTNAQNAGVAWSAGDAIAHTSETMQSFVEANDDLYVFTTQGIYRYTGTAQESVWTGGRKMYRSNNGFGAFLWEDGAIYVPYGDRLLRYDPLGDNTTTPSLNFVFPTEEMLGSPVLNGKITAITGDAQWLYMAVLTADGNTYIMKGKPSQGLWHTYLYVPSRTINAMQVFGGTRFHSTNPVLVFGGNVQCFYAILPKPGMRPEDDTAYRYEISTTNKMYGPWMSIGAREFPKFLTQARLITENCTAGMPITMAYELDGSGTETTLVEAVSSGVTATSTEDKTEFLRIRYIITMSSPDNTTTPRLLGALFHTNLLVPRKRMWTVDLELSPIVASGEARWTRSQQEAHLFGGLEERVLLRLFDGKEFAVLLQDVTSIEGTKVTPEGETVVLRAIFTEISETTANSNTMIWNVDLWNTRNWG